MADDPYVYPGTETLKNNMGIRDAGALAAIEADITHLALYEVTASGVPGSYDLAHLQEFHCRIFSDVYPWAGEIRTVDIAKTGLFGHAPHLRPYLNERFEELAKDGWLRQLPRERFILRLTYFLAR